MLVYDKTLLDNTLLADEANSLKKSGFIDSGQYTYIENKLPSLKRQKNKSIRQGFFLLGIFLYSSICSMLSIFSIDDEYSNFQILLFIYSLIGFVGIELLAKKNFYDFGIEEAFLLGAQILLFLGIGNATNENYLVVCIAIAVISTICYLRYIHLSSALLACIGITGCVVYFVFKFGSIGESVLPFVLILFAAATYFLSKNSIKKLQLPYYLKGIQLANRFSLVLFYLSGNCLVVRELSIVWLKKNIPATQEIDFAIFFYAFTLIVPVVYLVYSLIKKDKQMLWIGFLAFCFSILTIRYYHQIIPAEIALTFGGLLLFAFTYFSIKKIKNKETGITFLPDRFSDSNSLLNAEALIVASQFGLKPEIKPEESPMEFGGGDFSGGGSSGKF